MIKRLFSMLLCGLVMAMGLLSCPRPARAASPSAINANASLLQLLHALYDTPLEGLSSADLEDIIMHADYRKNRTLDFSAARVSALKKQGKLDASYQLTSLSGIGDLAPLKPVALKLSGQSSGMGGGAFSSISGLSTLEELDISSCGISSLSGLNLPNLKRFYAASNRIQDASSLSRFPKLLYLDLQDNALTELPKTPGLTVLIASDNPLNSFSALGQMTRLSELDLSHTQFDQNDFTSLRGLSKLQRMDLSFCQLDSILPLYRMIAGGDLQSLRNIKVEYNYLYFESEGGDSPERMGNVSILVNGKLPAQYPRRVTNTPMPKPTPATPEETKRPTASVGVSEGGGEAPAQGGVVLDDSIFLEMWLLQQQILLENQAGQGGAGSAGSGAKIFGIDPAATGQQPSQELAINLLQIPVQIGMWIYQTLAWRWMVRIL